jgi:RNA polymerase sigma factor (sigma-70 family)
MQNGGMLAEAFEANRAHLRGVAYRVLGSSTEADDAVQEAWLRLSRSDEIRVENLRAWLTTVVGRICLDMLRTRTARRERPLDELPDPVVVADDRFDPQHEAVLAESVSLALLVVLERLSPPERLAFVLHDMFDVPFDEVASVVGTSAAAARQLASRGRRRVRGAAPDGHVDLTRQRAVADAFLAAVREGNFERLLAILHPDVVRRVDAGPVRMLRGAREAATNAMSFSKTDLDVRPVLVEGRVGFASRTKDGKPFSIVALTIEEGAIVGIDIFVDPERLARIEKGQSGRAQA